MSDDKKCAEKYAKLLNKPVDEVTCQDIADYNAMTSKPMDTLPDEIWACSTGIVINGSHKVGLYTTQKPVEETPRFVRAQQSLPDVEEVKRDISSFFRDSVTAALVVDYIFSNYDVRKRD